MGFRAWLAGVFAAAPQPPPVAPGIEHLRARAALLTGIRRELAVSEALLGWWESRIDRLELEERQWSEWERAAPDSEIRARVSAVLLAIRAGLKRARREVGRSQGSVDRIEARVIAIEGDLRGDVSTARAYGYDAPGVRWDYDSDALRDFGTQEAARVIPEEPDSDERVFLAELMRRSTGGRLDVN